MPHFAEFLSEIMNTLLTYDIFPHKLKMHRFGTNSLNSADVPLNNKQNHIIDIGSTPASVGLIRHIGYFSLA